MTFAAFVNENDSFLTILTSAMKIQRQACDMMREEDFYCVYHCEKFKKTHLFNYPLERLECERASEEKYFYSALCKRQCGKNFCTEKQQSMYIGI